tara:strand:- start:181 stop:609 length:429 start_codon:yes stop_codon:yes gene_type:complete
MKNVILLFGVIFAVSCSPTKRLHRLIRNNPYLLTVKDTVIIKDTIKYNTDRVFRDSIFLINDARRDTVIIKENNLTIRTYINGDTIYMSGECDTIFIEVPYEKEILVDKVNFKETNFDMILKNWYWIVIVILVLIAIKFIKK